jgi:hypothetical protein
MRQYKMMIDKQRNSPEKPIPPSAVRSWKSSGASAITAVPHFSLLFDESRREEPLFSFLAGKNVCKSAGGKNIFRLFESIPAFSGLTTRPRGKMGRNI